MDHVLQLLDLHAQRLPLPLSPVKDVTFTKGSLKDTKGYEFGQKTIIHRFCPNCGSSVFEEMKTRDMLAVNIRHLRGVDVKALEFVHYDGFTKHGPQYEFA
ncbi:hypothetical protein FRB94_014257 [Tulasnella sp. JGI-2019a]|nr:hypothetical protein FRB93_005391 [Tulasnella sp. JGI-2019a]KAG9014164.1 hypothetical protein FRB94_014257 [Tulasnella sp. JGI-2019a]